MTYIAPHFYTDASPAEIERAITYMVNESGGHWTEPVSRSAPTAERSGEQVVRAQCRKCHETGVDGAPKIGDRTACLAGAGPGVHIGTQPRCHEPRGAMSCGSPMPRGEQMARPAEWSIHAAGRLLLARLGTKLGVPACWHTAEVSNRRPTDAGSS